MSSKTSTGRHRAATQVSPLIALSQAVASNTGSVGRQTAVVVAAAGLAASVALPSVATGQPETDPVSSATANTTLSTHVSARTDVSVDFQQATAASALAPQKRPAVESSGQTQSATLEQKQGGLAAVVAAAYQGLGTPYVWGGSTPRGWDCSGFTAWAYAQAGIKLPRTNQWNAMVQTSTPKPGDLVVQNGGSHVAIYVGNGMEIGALNPSQGTLLTKVSGVGSATYYTMS